MTSTPVGNASAVRFHVDDPPDNVLHILGVLVGRGLENQKLPGHADAEFLGLHVLQHEGGQIQYPQLVAQRRAADAQLFGQRLNGQVCFVDCPVVRPDDLDLAQILATFVFSVSASTAMPSSLIPATSISMYDSPRPRS